jgi:hypothetical protein
MVIGRAMAKDPAKRFPSATEFINALEAALQSKKDWHPLPRGASQTLPTAVAPAPKLPQRSEREREMFKEPEGGGLVWKMIGAALAGLAVVAVLFLAAQRWLEPAPDTVEVADSTPAKDAAPPPRAESPKPEAPKPEAPKPEAAKAEEPKPEPPEPRRVEPAPEKPRPRAPVVAAAPEPDETPYPLQLVTSPPGATATVDSDPSKTCQAPCSLELTAGRHTVAIQMEGYRRELRIIELHGPQEVFFNLSRAGGTVRVESQPPGAQILINGEMRRETTPASIRLPVGKYHITVIRDGRKADQEIEVRDGALLRYTLDLNP